MPEFSKQQLTVNGLDVSVLSAGEGDPLVYFHGESTQHGFNHLLPLAERRRLVIPIHPGFGESADDPSIDTVHDYVLHYLDLLDMLEIAYFGLIGFSLGAWLAAVFAGERNNRVRQLALVAPLGLRVPEHPSTDVFSMPTPDMAKLLTNKSELAARPEAGDVEGLVLEYRESMAVARVMWERNYDTKLPKWLRRNSMPSLLMWGQDDRITPAAQATAWREHMPQAQVDIVPGAGHLVLEENQEAVRRLAGFVSAAPAR